MLTNKEMVKTTLICGESSLNRIFLFHIALYWAKMGRRVFYLCPKEIDHLPMSDHGQEKPSVDVLKMITFIYTPDYEVFIAQLVQLYNHNSWPKILLIEDLDHFANHADIIGPRDLHVAQLCASIVNCVAEMSEKTEGEVIRLCAASNSQDFAQIYSMFFDKFWNLGMQENLEDDQEKLLLLSNKRKIFKYSVLNDNVVVLKEVLES